MKVRFGKLVLLAASTALAVVGLAYPATAQTSIIGGSNASSGPWAARLFVNGQQNCTATIIAPQYILTAKHCVSSSRHVHVPDRQPGPVQRRHDGHRVDDHPLQRRRRPGDRPPDDVGERNVLAAGQRRRRLGRPERLGLRLGRDEPVRLRDQLPVAIPEGRDGPGELHRLQRLHGRRGGVRQPRQRNHGRRRFGRSDVRLGPSGRRRLDQ